MPSRAWRTRLQPIRTLVHLPIEISLVDHEQQPIYQKHSEKIRALRDLGMNKSQISKRLRVSRSVVDDALAWMGRD